eukprot:8464377-Prorocentrum_lima.AAC.1
MASIRETFENSLRNCVPLRFIMSTYELLEYDDPRRSYQYLEQQVIKFQFTKWEEYERRAKVA